MSNGQHKTIRLGEKGTGEFGINILRGFKDGEEYHYAYIEYVCHGVDSVDIQDQFNTGGDMSLIQVNFSNGEREYIHGVISDIFTYDE